MNHRPFRWSMNNQIIDNKEMVKFKLGRKQSDENEIRRSISKEQFHLQKLCHRGFPSRPSAIAYDFQLQLIGIGTESGEIRIYGQVGFTLSYSLDSAASISKLIFLTGVARLLVLTSDGYLHLLELNNIPSLHIDRICTSDPDSRIVLKQIHSSCLLRDHSTLLIGLNDGNIYRFDLENFHFHSTQPMISNEMIEKIIRENCHERFVHPGSVQSIVQHPTNDEKLLLGYKHTVIVHWDLPSNSHDRTYLYNQDVESVCWFKQGKNFASSHSNGSYALWDSEQQFNLVESEKFPYGPFPCTPMTKIIVKSTRNGDPLLIFAGGLPRSSYANKHTVSCLCEKEYLTDRPQHVTFDFTTAVIDFFTMDQISNNETHDIAQTLVVLLHEEIVFIDLTTDNWPLHRLPYLNSIHASPVICTTIVSRVTDEFYEKLCRVAAEQFEDYSDRKWPLTGGELIPTIGDYSNERRLLLTGHEDGSVQFWDVTDFSMPLIYKLKTSEFFQLESTPTDDTDAENWPPFRKTGLFDPYSDDPRLAIQKLALCSTAETLIVAGSAGQILTFQFSTVSTDDSIPSQTVHLLEGRESYVWSGHDELKTKQTSISAGFRAKSLVQLFPPAPVSALALCTDIRTYAVGTTHGVALINYEQNQVLLTKCTLNSQDVSASSKPPVSAGPLSLTRGRSLKKSLRESFRRLRKGRTITKNLDEPKAGDEPGRVPVERQVEFRDLKSINDHGASMVRCLYFVKTYLSNVHDQTRSLWIGTNAGHVYAYSIAGFDAKTIQDSTVVIYDQSVICALSKEIRLKHKAPVLSITVLDGQNQPIHSDSSAMETRTTTDSNPGTTVSSHKVLICSEEQFKIFTLPNLKPICKFKLTATEGSRVRRIAVNRYLDPINESSLVCLDNMGHISIYSLPSLRRQADLNCMKPTDINALSSLQFSSSARAFYLQSTSEFAEIAVLSQIQLSYSMAVVYDKSKRKSIQRSNKENVSLQRTQEVVVRPIEKKIDENDQEKLSPKSVQSQQETSPGTLSSIAEQKQEENTGLSTRSDSAIELNPNETPNDEATPMSDETPGSLSDQESPDPVKVIDDQFPSLLSSTSRKKGPAPLPPVKPTRVSSSKTRPAPKIDQQIHSNGVKHESHGSSTAV